MWQKHIIPNSLCTNKYSAQSMYRHIHKNQQTQNLYTTLHPVKRFIIKHTMTKIIWKYIKWISVGIKIGDQTLLENEGKQGKHQMTSIPKKILYKNGILRFLMSPVQKTVYTIEGKYLCWDQCWHICFKNMKGSDVKFSFP